MLDEEEYELVMEAGREGMDFVREEQERLGLSDLPWPDWDLPSHWRERERAMLAMYRLLTGWPAISFRNLYQHRIELHGPPCPSCEKPLRTSQAGYCPACGYGSETMSEDSRPLVEREPESFEDI